MIISGRQTAAGSVASQICNYLHCKAAVEFGLVLRKLLFSAKNVGGDETDVNTENGLLEVYQEINGDLTVEDSAGVITTMVAGTDSADNFVDGVGLVYITALWKDDNSGWRWTVSVVGAIVGIIADTGVTTKGALPAVGGAFSFAYNMVVGDWPGLTRYYINTLGYAVSLISKIITAIFTQGDAKYYARMEVPAAFSAEESKRMFFALERLSEAKLTAITESIYFDNVDIPISEQDREYRLKMLTEFPDHNEIVQVPAVSSVDLQAATWFTGNFMNIIDKYNLEAVSLIKVDLPPEKKARVS